MCCGWNGCRRREDDQLLVTHLYFCHIGSEPSHNASLRHPNQTTTVEMNFTLDGVVKTLGGTLEWGGDEGYCDDLGIVVGQSKSTGKHFVETFREHNARRYWPAFMSLPEPKHPMRHFPIMDGISSGDGDLNAMRDGLVAAKRLGIRGVLSSSPAWLAEEVLGYKLINTGSEVGNFEWQAFDTLKIDNNNFTMWAEQTAAATLSRGYTKTEVLGASALDDEPGFTIPLDFPPLDNVNFTDVKTRWHSYLQSKGLTPSDLGASSWDVVLPSSAGAAAGSPLAARRLYYWSLRFVSSEGSRFLSNCTDALTDALSPATPIYVNWNNMAGHWYYPGVNGSGQLNHDWFSHARQRGTTMLWTEDWFGDGLSCTPPSNHASLPLVISDEQVTVLLFSTACCCGAAQGNGHTMLH
jgi:hypothetical protein|eukprot:COSAG03_NODE_2787_length_2453_cov_10.718777_2_plen_409_part_00